MSQREFTTGETVHLTAEVSRSGTNQPTDPATVSLTALRRDGVAQTLPALTAFVRQATGVWTMSLSTSGWLAGVYDLQVTLESGPTAVMQIRDTFVLRPAL